MTPKITYPHMGYMNIPVSNMLRNLGIEVVEAPPITKKTVELGALHSPAEVCLPYKINMGNFLEGLGEGANTLVSLCGAGKCRLGFYNTVQKIALDEYKPLQFYSINISENIFPNLYRFLHSVAPHTSKWSIISNIISAIKCLKALDELNCAKNYFGARTHHSDDIIKIYNSGLKEFSNVSTGQEIHNKKELILSAMGAIADNSDVNPLKVGIIGEFYVLLEPFVNNNIENRLIRQGVEVKRFVYSGRWVYANSLLRALGLYNEEKDYLAQARPYLNHHVGGDGLKTVGSALWCAKNGYDGIIHVYPFGCMPEVVAQYALQNLAHDYDLPLLSLSLDEHASDVGIVTRIEAFIDCMKRRQHRE
ncbi:MAG TPA: hypothetical protein PKA28_03355 [Methylomusa anaerophila]|uniref:2-hydroxyglutaryl-CoA dehydratase, D-component n=1 Tax=Methylomusa anaerophila TaxID=1930071 RepID=A0A348ANN6_9FIRM|nr:hypothetical protein [Methylomusa anaerophila]BBB92684.1 hypothetical protein MAMMFC1_03379 [Methylomusa anaerophila]HML87463.1 hypothetical protein [Methylomusa anaerophila]